MSQDEKRGLPVVRSRTRISKSGSKKPPAGSFLAKVRAASAQTPEVAAAAPPRRGDPALVAAALTPRSARPRLVFALDATASREPAWEAAKATTDALFSAVPGELDVALAVHGGSRIQMFSDFTASAGDLRDRAATVACKAGVTRLVEIMTRCRDLGGVRVLVYIGDVFEEDLAQAEEVAASLRLRGTRVVVLHDRAQAPALDASAEAFHIIAKITGGAVLPFDAASRTKLRDMLEALATFAVGGIKLLRERSGTLPGASDLLKRLPAGKP